MSDRIPCKQKSCDRQILPTTAKNTGGLCMLCFKASKGIAHITPRTPSTNTDRNFAPGEIEYTDTCTNILTKVTPEYLRHILELLADVLDEGMSEEQIQLILNRYKNIDEGKSKHINLDLFHSGFAFRSYITVRKDKSSPKEIEVSLPNKIVHLMNKKCGAELLSCNGYAPTDTGFIKRFVNRILK